jgi:hypothetical protein
MKSAGIERDEKHYSETHEVTSNSKRKQNKRVIEGVYEQSLELPVPIVLAGIWLVGTVPIALCVLAFYLLWLLVGTVPIALCMLAFFYLLWLLVVVEGSEDF